MDNIIAGNNGFNYCVADSPSDITPSKNIFSCIYCEEELAIIIGSLILLEKCEDLLLQCKCGYTNKYNLKKED